MNEVLEAMSTTTIRRLLEAESLRRPVVQAMINALHLPAGSHGLDAGCGIGLQAQLLAEAVGPAGHVTGMDLAPDLLAYGEGLARQAGLAGRISFEEGDVCCLPFEDDSFDWAWSVDCVGYPAGELLPGLCELARVVRPGGAVALMGWTSQMLLPGYPLLEAQLNATCSAYAPYLAGRAPASHFLRAPAAFAGAGLEQVECHTFADDVQAPLDKERRRALVSLFEMLWNEPEAGAAAESWAAHQRLCNPDSPEFVLDLEGYYAFFTYTMIRGRVPQPAVDGRQAAAAAEVHG